MEENDLEACTLHCQWIGSLILTYLRLYFSISRFRDYKGSGLMYVSGG